MFRKTLNFMLINNLFLQVGCPRVSSQGSAEPDSGSSEMPEQLLELADVFGVSADVIVGRESGTARRNGPKGKLKKCSMQPVSFRAVSKKKSPRFLSRSFKPIWLIRKSAKRSQIAKVVLVFTSENSCIALIRKELPKGSDCCCHY